MVDLIYPWPVSWYISKATGDEPVKTVLFADFVDPCLTFLNLQVNPRQSLRRAQAIIDRISWSRVLLNDQIQRQVAE